MITGKKQSVDLFLQLLFPLGSFSHQNLESNIFEDLFSISKEHQLFPLIYYRLHGANAKMQKPLALEQFLELRRAMYLNVVAHSLRLEAQEQRIISVLLSENLPALVFKGTSIARELYGDPSSRASVDIDLLIRQNDMPQVDRVLSNAGYKREGALPFTYLFQRIQHATYKNGVGEVPVDVHWTFGVPWFFDLKSEEIWEEVSLIDEGNYELSPEMLIVMLLMHYHLHFFRELRVLVDLLWALEKYSEVIDWRKFAARLQKIGLSKTALLVLNQVKDIWGSQVNEIKGIQQLKEELKELKVNVPQWLNSYYRLEIDQTVPHKLYKDKFYSRLVLDSCPAIFSSYFKTLFPSPKAVKVLYEDDRVWMLPINYLRFMKWRIGEWRGKSQ